MCVIIIITLYFNSYCLHLHIAGTANKNCWIVYSQQQQRQRQLVQSDEESTDDSSSSLNDYWDADAAPSGQREGGIDSADSDSIHCPSPMTTQQHAHVRRVRIRRGSTISAVKAIGAAWYEITEGTVEASVSMDLEPLASRSS